jgi:protein-L-isoaspartate(D-aspartate) O-methyltransferase
MVDFEHARRQMVDAQLRTNNVTDRRLLAVMEQIPRELFVPAARRELAYIDEAHPVGLGNPPRYVPAPASFARLVQLAEVASGDAVLDVGCATGYSTAVLAGLAASVIGIEGEASLVRLAREALAALAIGNATVVEAPGMVLPRGQGPFDVIVVEGAVDTVPEALFAQLKEGGRLVASLSGRGSAVAHVYVRSPQGIASRAAFDSDLPPLWASQRNDEFVF